MLNGLTIGANKKKITTLKALWCQVLTALVEATEFSLTGTLRTGSAAAPCSLVVKILFNRKVSHETPASANVKGRGGD